MELFTLGEGEGYTERDVREQARALTGFRYDWKRGRGPVNFRYDRRRHDGGTQGRVRQARTVRLARRLQPLPRRTRRTRASSSRSSGARSCPSRPTLRTRRALERLYRDGYEVRPVLDAILRHPALYLGPRMVKPPVVYTAGLLRALGRRVDTTAWVWLGEGAGQRLF